MGADVGQGNERRHTLIYIATGSYAEVLQYYLSNNEAIKKIDHRFFSNETPLLHAVKLNKFKNTKLLIEYGADTSMKYKINGVQKNIFEAADYYLNLSWSELSTSNFKKDAVILSAVNWKKRCTIATYLKEILKSKQLPSEENLNYTVRDSKN